MFPLTRTHRQIAATFLLVAVSVAPTVVICTLVASLLRPAHVRDVEVELGRMLDSDVSIDRVRHPRPGEDEFFGVTLRTQGGGVPRELMRCERLLATTEGEGLTLQVEGLSLRPQDPEQAIDHLDSLAARLVSHYRRVGLIASKAELRREENWAIAVDDLAAVIEKKGTSRQISTSFRLQDAEHSGRHELTILVDPGEPARRWQVILATREGTLPVAALGGLVDVEDWFGADARLEGTLAWHRAATQRDWSFELRGRIHDVDLARLAAHFPGNSLQGRAVIDIDTARWDTLPNGQGTGWLEARGRLRCGPGAIGPPLLDALAREMRFRPALAAWPDRGSELVGFDALDLAFALTNEGGLTVKGASEATGSHSAVILAHDHVPLLYAPDGASTVRALWKTLFPVGGDVLVPATQDTRVMRHLPLPRAAGMSGTAMQAN